MEKQKIRCFLIGHKVKGKGTVCMNCKSQEYYDRDTWDDSGYLLKPFTWIKRQFLLFVSWWEFVFEDTLPF